VRAAELIGALAYDLIGAEQRVEAVEPAVAVVFINSP
jgi:hypothetical protein